MIWDVVERGTLSRDQRDLIKSTSDEIKHLLSQGQEIISGLTTTHSRFELMERITKIIEYREWESSKDVSLKLSSLRQLHR